MQADRADGDADSFSDTHEGDVRGAGPPGPVNNVAAAHELDQIRSDALRDIDEGGFSCVASLSVPVFRLLTHRALKLVSL